MQIAHYNPTSVTVRLTWPTSISLTHNPDSKTYSSIPEDIQESRITFYSHFQQ